jgi:hypothetical protein
MKVCLQVGAFVIAAMYLLLQHNVGISNVLEIGLPQAIVKSFYAEQVPLHGILSRLGQKIN